MEKFIFEEITEIQEFRGYTANYSAERSDCCHWPTMGCGTEDETWNQFLEI